MSSTWSGPWVLAMVSAVCCAQRMALKPASISSRTSASSCAILSNLGLNWGWRLARSSIEVASSSGRSAATRPARGRVDVRYRDMGTE
jgi:hypothetical protein